MNGFEVRRAPSGVVFRFGNSGTLRSDEALFLQRNGKGWLRIEVVPRSTPFLISNAVIEGMKGVVDPYLNRLTFHGSDRRHSANEKGPKEVAMCEDS